MAINTFGTLKSAVANWLHRTDLTIRIPEFVALCESNIRSDLRCRAMEATATGSLSSTTLALPSNLAEVRRFVIGTTLQTYVAPHQFYEMRDSSNGHYTIVGSNIITQTSSGDYSLDYYGWFTAFSDDGDTNWLLTYHPDVYLFGSLAEAMGYTGGDPTTYYARYRNAIQKARAADQRFGERLAIRPDIRPRV